MVYYDVYSIHHNYNGMYTQIGSLWHIIFIFMFK